MKFNVAPTLFSFGVASILYTGCASPPPGTNPPPQSTAAGKAPGPDVTPASCAVRRPGGGAAGRGMPTDDTEDLDLTTAISRALRQNPQLAGIAHEVQAAHARTRQARALPNPELALELEEFDRDGTGLDAAELSIFAGQRLELGGKRRWRMRAAEAEGELAAWAYARARIDLRADTAQRFVDLLVAKRRLALARSMVELAERTHQAVSERVASGKEPPLQASQSAAELELARLDALDARNARHVAATRLAATWGGDGSDLDTARGDLDSILEALPALASLQARLPNHPALARADARRRHEEARLSAAKAARVPDIAATVGYVRYEEDGSDALAFGIGIPLPLFDRNQGNIAAARQARLQGEAERRHADVTASADLIAQYTAWKSAHHRARALRTTVIPAMEEALQASRDGYQEGKFEFLTLLDAQRKLFEANASLLNTLAAYHAAAVQIERLTATRIHELIQTKEEPHAID